MVFTRDLAIEPQETVAVPLHVGPSAHGAHIVRNLYESFNRCDVEGTSACFTDDVVYEDLLLGNSTIVESRDDFRELIQTHPVFVAKKACAALGLPPLDVAVRVDGLAEDAPRQTVGVEWHVEVGGRPIALGRGLSFMRICPKTGLIRHAVDVAEAPWRTVGLLLAPFARGLRGLSRFLAGLLLPPLVVGGTSSLVLFGFFLVFLDRASMDSFREGVDSLADFRDRIEVESFEGLLATLPGVIG